MNVLVTGGAGFIGTHAGVALLESGYNIIVADNLANSNAAALGRVKRITGGDFPFYQIDVRDKEALENIFRAHEIGCVMHFAGLKAVGESVSRPLDYYENNLNSTLALLRAMSKFGVGSFIFSSSATVYSADNAMPLTEDSKTGGCSNPYGWTKFMCEQILKSAAFADKNLSIVLLRYFNPIGAHESGLIGEDPRGVPNNLMPFIVQTAIGRRERLSVYGDDYDTPDGSGVRDYIHVMDLAEGHVAAVEYCAAHSGVETFNLGTGRGTSVLELVSAFEQASGVNVPKTIAPRRPGDIAACWAATEKAERVLGWKARRSIADMCADSWRWQSMNPMGYAASTETGDKS